MSNKQHNFLKAQKIDHLKINFRLNIKSIFIIFSGTEINQEKLGVLVLGLKFCDTRNHINYIDSDIQFENLNHQTSDLFPTSDQELEHFKSKLDNCCYQFKNSRYIYRNNLTKKHKQTISELSNDEDLTITKPDKGTGTILLNKKDYIEKMNNILNRHLKFQKLSDQKENELTRSSKKPRDR